MTMYKNDSYIILIVLVFQNMIAASQRRVKTVDIAVIEEEDTTVPASNIISEETALVSCTACTAYV